MSAFVHDPRRAMTPARVARIFAAHDGKCHECKRKLRAGDDYEIDHVLALATGGSDDDANCAPICSGCHLVKTKGDVTAAAKIKRVATGHTVPRKFRQSRGWGRR